MPLPLALIVFAAFGAGWVDAVAGNGSGFIRVVFLAVVAVLIVKLSWDLLQG